MDPGTGAAILGLSIAGKEGVAVVAEFVRQIVTPTAKAIGEGLATPVKRWAESRDRRAEKIVMDAAVMLDEAGITPQAVPDQVSIPLLLAGSIADAPELQTRWAALLANAATPDNDSDDPERVIVIPGFVEILRQLTPIQARILDWMYATMEAASIAANFPQSLDFEQRSIEEEFQLSEKQYLLLAPDLERLQLIEPRRQLRRVVNDGQTDEMVRLAIDRWNLRVSYESIGLTSLGIQFIEACRPPSKQP